MKSPSVLAIVVLTGLVAGGAGYQFGVRQSRQLTRETGNQVLPGQRPAPPLDHRPVMDKTGLTRLVSDLDAETDPLKRFNLALSRMEAWVAADPRGALAWLTSQQASGRRDEVIHRALLQYAEKDPKGAAEWARENLSGTDFNNSLIRICEQWARNNGREAADWTSALPQSQARDAALEGLTFAWASQDPAAAQDYLRSHNQDPTLASILRYAAFAGWAKTDPQNAVRASLQSSRDFNDPEQFANTLANWATVDVANAGKWLLENPLNPDERTAAVKELAGIYASQSPDAGIAWINKLDGNDKRDALREFADGWASSDAAGAAKWAATLPADGLDEEAAAKILHGFLAENHAAFDTWRNSLPDGPLKQQAMKVGATSTDE